MQMAIDVAGFTAAEADQLRQAMGSKRSRQRMERLRQRLYDGMAERGITGDGGRRDLREDGRLRQLRLPREPLGVVRLPRVRVGVDQAARAGGVLRRAAQRPADGLLLAAVARAGRPPPRGGGAHPDLNVSDWRRHARRPAPTRTTAWRCGSGCRTCARSATTWPRRSPPAVPTPTWRTSCAGCRRSPSAHLEALATAGAFGVLRRCDPPGGAVGGGRGGPEPARAAWPASSPGPTRPRCRA